MSCIASIPGRPRNSLWAGIETCSVECPTQYSLLLQGIGDTAQGTVNGVIFCLFKPAIRAKIYKSLTSIFCKRLIYDVRVEESIQCDGDVDVDQDKDAIDSEHNRPLLFVASNSYTDYKATTN